MIIYTEFSDSLRFIIRFTSKIVNGLISTFFISLISFKSYAHSFIFNIC